MSGSSFSDSGTLVLDASAALEVILRKDGAKRFIDRIFLAKKVCSTELFRAETANALAKYAKGGFLSKEKCLEALSLADGMVDEYCPIRENETEACSEAIRMEHSVYDLLYMTLARRQGAMLLTCDQKLANLCKREGVPVVLNIAPGIDG